MDWLYVTPNETKVEPAYVHAQVDSTTTQGGSSSHGAAARLLHAIASGRPRRLEASTSRRKREPLDCRYAEARSSRGTTGTWSVVLARAGMINSHTSYA